MFVFVKVEGPKVAHVPLLVALRAQLRVNESDPEVVPPLIKDPHLTRSVELLINASLSAAPPTGFAVYQPKWSVPEVASIVGFPKALLIDKVFKVAVPVRVKEVPEATPILGVTRVGEMARTLLPDPVLAIETRFFEASVATAEEAVKLES